MGFWSDVVDNVGTTLRLPEIGLSEFYNGGKRTSNTGRVSLDTNLASNKGTSAYYSATNAPLTKNNVMVGGGSYAPMSGAAGISPVADTFVGGDGRTYSYSAGGGGAAVPVGPSQAQLNPLFSSLDSLDTILGNKNAQSQAEYDRAIAGYNDADNLDRQAYDKNVRENETAYTSGNQAGLLNAANGAKGLRGVLASLGALSGSGMDVINRLVGLAANQDTGAVLKNFEANAGNLNQSWQATERQHRQRRDDALATLENNKQNNKASVLNSRKGIYEQLSNLYGDGTAQGNDYAAKASALAPEIAATTRASVAPYAAASAAYSPQALQQYLAGTQNLNVDTKGAQQAPINSPLFAANEKKKDSLVGVA